ncbi:MAG: LysR family transcriptional regulator, partial [Variovorax sp.]
FGLAIVPASMAAQAPAGVRALPLDGEGCRSGVLVLWREGGPRHALALRESLQAAFAPSI